MNRWTTEREEEEGRVAAMVFLSIHHYFPLTSVERPIVTVLWQASLCHTHPNVTLRLNQGERV
uniref:Uncharacterized protein n=1 Tax=Gadus morhua TaxID=8049 RepID=A0A8C5CLG4_GADMO